MHVIPYFARQDADSEDVYKHACVGCACQREHYHLKHLELLASRSMPFQQDIIGGHEGSSACSRRFGL